MNSSVNFGLLVLLSFIILGVSLYFYNRIDTCCPKKEKYDHNCGRCYYKDYNGSIPYCVEDLSYLGDPECQAEWGW